MSAYMNMVFFNNHNSHMNKSSPETQSETNKPSETNKSPKLSYFPKFKKTKKIISCGHGNFVLVNMNSKK